MFLALRDIRFAKGRFALIATVVTLITLLVGFLTGLTAGLGNQNISSILDMKASSIVFSNSADDENISWGDSKITPDTFQAWEQSGATVTPLAIQRAKAIAGKDASVILFGTPAGNNVLTGDIKDTPARNGEIVLSENAAEELSTATGEEVTIGAKSYKVSAVTKQSWYQHGSVVRMTLDDINDYASFIGQKDAFANVLLLSGDVNENTSVSGSVVKSKISSLTALETFKSEIGSLAMMISMLIGISALVIGAFFTVWIIQRKPDIAVLKALGVSTKALVKDSLTQAFIILIIGTVAGISLTFGLGLLAGQALPFMMNPATLGIPSLLMIVTGLFGAAIALRPVIKSDPLTALNSSH